MHKPQQSFVDRCIRDKNGIVTIGQKPNLPQIIGLIGLVVVLLSSGTIRQIAIVCTAVAWAAWALLEISSGANYLRRLFGIVVIVIIVIVTFRHSLL